MVRPSSHCDVVGVMSGVFGVDILTTIFGMFDGKDLCTVTKVSILYRQLCQKDVLKLRYLQYRVEYQERFREERDSLRLQLQSLCLTPWTDIQYTARPPRRPHALDNANPPTVIPAPAAAVAENGANVAVAVAERTPVPAGHYGIPPHYLPNIRFSNGRNRTASDTQEAIPVPAGAPGKASLFNLISHIGFRQQSEPVQVSDVREQELLLDELLWEQAEMEWNSIQSRFPPPDATSGPKGLLGKLLHKPLAKTDRGNFCPVHLLKGVLGLGQSSLSTSEGR
eukprot:GILK01011168.1.p1 GENE.GILK01011168.1~~GILK01011168.1.p1  ORF type:complete len:281 (-),score=36.03 GILK01011168.1:215-1057(-)